MTPDRVLGATVVSGIISGIWTTNGSPYVLTADCSVLADQSLAIDPGVTVIIEPDVGVDVFGQINAVGTPGLPITIRGASSSRYWRTIRFVHSPATNRFISCSIRDGITALQFVTGSGVPFSSAELVFDCHQHVQSASMVVHRYEHSTDSCSDVQGPATAMSSSSSTALREN